ncbi:hypothetical protein AVEN_208641-1 [Araneus ventricosus]|uniref:Uncharacterized protein n=1 Tax=Araneus ventricosus TaxID=182803 RepID=A0A4Y2FGE2_ARAVE|nr:hypothetical protein AVEN_208641-1 [Araneus ventricosus]
MLRVVTVEQSRIILYKGFKVKPGQKLCASCRNKLLKIKQIDESNVQNSLNTEDEDHDVEFTPAELLQKRNVIAELNSSFHEIGCSPMKLHALGEHSRSFYGKEKLQRVHETVKEKIQNVLEVDLLEEKNDVEKSVIKKSEDLDKLVDIINLKIGLSKFCSLRPKWCVLAGASGTHLVCVCTIHQNVILLIHGAGFEEEYKQLMSYIVCEGAGRECMLRHYDKCPSKDNLVQFLQAKFEDYDDEDIVEYNQWVSTDRTEMIRCSTAVGELIEKLVEKLNKLIPHSYIAKSQSSFLKNLKGTASSNTAVVSMDFSENYAFTIQDEAQGYHWNSNSCTIHPVMIHCKDTSNVKLIIPLCIISDDLKHDVSMVYEIQKNVTAFLKENYPHITNIHYFSDGCAGQYKNKYNFMNLCLHEKDFKLKAQWSFFATSHGKTECDGIGGTVKRLARKKSLQQHLDRQITTTNELFEFCKVNIANITFQHISKEAVDSTSLTLESRLKDTQTLPGTRLFHNFQPIDDLEMIEARRISRDETPALTFNLLKHQTLLVKMKDLYPGCFVGCIYDNLWYFGMVSEVNAEDEDVTVKFLHPNGPSLSFFWPNREDVCAVPIPHIIAIVKPPKIMTGRTYQFSQECMLLVKSSFENI